MASKTRMIDLVKAFDAPGVDLALTESPELLAWRGDRGRNWLHLLCGVEIGPGREAAASIRTAETLLRHGIDLQDIAFVEGDWRATPVWFCISRGRNLALAQWLLERGADPNHALWAAAYNSDLAAIDLLIRHGAVVDDPSVAETPFLWAIQNSRFAAAEALLAHGADVNALDGKGQTALHLMLKKGSDRVHFEALIAAGARGDLPDREGRTARQILSRKKDPAFRALADRLA